MMDIKVSKGKCNSVHPPFLLWGGGGMGWVEPPTKFSKKGGLDRISILRGDYRERGVTFFRELKLLKYLMTENFIKNVFLCHN